MFRCLFLLLLLDCCVCSVVDQYYVYEDASQPIPDRVADVLKRMTLEQKVAQLLHPWVASPQKSAEEYCKEYNSTGLGAIYLFWCGKSRTAAGLLADRNTLQKCILDAAPPGVKIPVTFVEEALHSGGHGSTIYPMPCNMGTTWNVKLVQEVHEQIAFQTRVHGADRSFSPVANAATDPRFGRQQESWGEDPHHVTMMTIAAVEGLQGKGNGGPASYLKTPNSSIIATCKSYVAYARTSGGIDGSPADMSESRLQDIYLVVWRELAKRGLLRSVMAGQNMVNGVPNHANKKLLMDVLRTEFKLSNPLVVSDGADCIGALIDFHIVATREQAAVVAVSNGMDQDLGAITLPKLIPAVKSGKISIDKIDRAVSDVLTSKFASGVFDNPYSDPSLLPEGLDNPQTRATALQAATESVIMLKNDDDLLPFADLSTMSLLAVIGPLANDTTNQCGGYTSAGAHVETVLTAAESILGKNKVQYSKGATPDAPATQKLLDPAIALAKKADAVILVVGDDQLTCGEMSDRMSLDLPGGQLELMTKIQEVNKKVVLVLIHGRVVTFGPSNLALGNVKAVLSAWRPGEEGGRAVMNIISGKESPSGKTAQSWPRSVGHVGGPNQPYMYPFQGDHFNENYVFESSSPLFPFGWGLTYTKWEHTMSVTPKTISMQNPESKHFNVTVHLHNIGTNPASQVVQVYFTDVVASSVRIAHVQLIRFSKVHVEAGHNTQVNFAIPIEDLGFYSAIENKRVLEAGEFIFYVSLDGAQVNKSTPQETVSLE